VKKELEKGNCYKFLFICYRVNVLRRFLLNSKRAQISFQKSIIKVIQSPPEDKTFKSRCAAQQKELIVTFICFETVLPTRIARLSQLKSATEM
jgi:hypothetical protein